MQLSLGLLKNKFLIFVLVWIISINSVFAAKVGIVVEFKNGDIYKECVDVSENIDGYDLLQKTKLNILWSPTSAFGQLICKINGEGTDVKGNFCEFFGDFWNFNIAKNNGWLHSPVGHNGPGGCWNRDENSFVGHYCAKNGDVLGYKFTDSGAPPLINFDDICNTNTRLGITSVKAFVNGKKKSGIDEKGGTIEAKPGSTIKLEVEVSNRYSKNDGTELKDVNVEGILDLNFDVRDESNEFDLEANSDRKVTLNFKIPENEPKGTYDLELNVEGEDKNDNKYKADLNFDVDIEKESHKIAINDLSLIPSISGCKSNPLLNIELLNVGDNEESGTIKISNKELGIDVEIPFKVSVDSIFKKSLKLGFGNVVSDIYLLEASIIYNNGQSIEKSIANLVVKCKENQILIKSPQNKKLISPQNTQNQQITSLAPNEKPFIIKYKIPIMIIGAQIALLVLSIVFLIHALKR